MSDLISRADAICEVLVNDGIDNIVERIKALPSAEAEWVPVSERLPEEGRYLVTTTLSVFSPQILNYDEDGGEWFYDGCKSMDVEVPCVIAWMPLPKPWKGADDE